MLTKATIKLVQSLNDKKSRQEHGLFVAEGAKTVNELPASKIKVKTLFATEQWARFNTTMLTTTDIVVVSDKELKQLSHLATPSGVIALCELPQENLTIKEVPVGLTLVLDKIQDPGNMGTIIRIADWYAVNTVVCSPGCADLYNPKVLNATMGSFMRVNMVEYDLESFFESHPQVEVYGALLEGRSLYEVSFSKNAALMIGNEGAGISPSLRRYVKVPVSIPGRGGAESLNAAVATGIICDAWARGLSA